MDISRRHHYLPEFFLKGFTGDDNKLSVFDLEKKELKPNRFSPKQIFYEYDRNSYTIQGEKDDFIEKWYQQIETKIAPVFKKIQNTDIPNALEVKEMLNIIMFLGYTYWRSPNIDNDIKDFITPTTHKELHFTMRDKATNLEVPQEEYVKLFELPVFAGFYRILKPIYDYLKGFDINKIENWIVYHAANENKLHLVGDNPVIFKNDTYSNMFDQELIMRLTCKKEVFHTKGKKVDIISAVNSLNIDILTVLQSKKYICGPNRDYLLSIYHYAQKYNNEEDILRIKEELFSVFY